MIPLGKYGRSVSWHKSMSTFSFGYLFFYDFLNGWKRETNVINLLITELFQNGLSTIPHNLLLQITWTDLLPQFSALNMWICCSEWGKKWPILPHYQEQMHISKVENWSKRSVQATCKGKLWAIVESSLKKKSVKEMNNMEEKETLIFSVFFTLFVLHARLSLFLIIYPYKLPRLILYLNFLL